MRSLTLALLAVLGGSATVPAQVEDLMKREIDEALEVSRWRAGPFRLTPTLRVGGGRDSNPLSSPGSDPIEDVTFLAGPGLRGVVPMGIRGLIDLYQELDFVYYRDLDQLRDLASVTRASGAIGGRDFVLHLNGAFQTGKVRPTTELDIPLERRAQSLGAALDVALGSAQQLNLIYDNVRYEYQDPDSGDVGVSVPNLLDRTEETYRLQFERYVTSTASTVVEGMYDLIDYVDNTTERDGRAYGGLAGFVFSPRGDIRGRALFGYKRLEPDVVTQAEFRGFVGSADVVFPMGNRFRLRGLYSRDTRPSILVNNWFFVENRFGGFLDVYLAKRWFVRPGALVGDNTYPRATTFADENGQRVMEVVKDDFEIYSFSINYELSPDLIISVGADYQRRESNLPLFNKDRTVFTVGLTAGI